MDAVAVHARRQPLTADPVVPERFAHFVLRTSNPAPMRDWYKTVLAARIVFEDDRLCFLTYDDEHHRLALITVPGLEAPAEKAWGLAHVAYSYATLRDLLSTWRRLKDHGIEPYRPINHGPTVSMYYKDPDGNAVELQVDAYPTKDLAAGFFDTEAFRQNPVGVPFDPAELAAAFEAGVPEEELLRRP
jgi:catechol 2,3-dioxygenase-like lactoylglutathione lyase family enzyme